MDQCCRIDEDDYGGHQPLLAEGLAPCVSVFLVCCACAICKLCYTLCWQYETFYGVHRLYIDVVVTHDVYCAAYMDISV